MGSFKFRYEGLVPRSVEIDGDWVTFQPNEEREFDSEFREKLINVKGIVEISETEEKKKKKGE